jgi:hypothetical protein
LPEISILKLERQGCFVGAGKQGRDQQGPQDGDGRMRGRLLEMLRLLNHKGSQEAVNSFFNYIPGDLELVDGSRRPQGSASHLGLKDIQVVGNKRRRAPAEV